MQKNRELRATARGSRIRRNADGTANAGDIQRQQRAAKEVSKRQAEMERIRKLRAKRRGRR
jgi:hypothetical protein